MFGRFSTFSDRDRNWDLDGSSYLRDANDDHYGSGYNRDRGRDREYRDGRSLDLDHDRAYRDRSHSWDRKYDRERPRSESPHVSARSPPPCCRIGKPQFLWS